METKNNMDQGDVVATSESLNVPFGNATSKSSSSSTDDAITPTPPRRSSSLRTSSRRRSSQSSSSSRRQRRSSDIPSILDDDDESLLLAKRTDKLIADFQEYICDIEQTSSTANGATTSTPPPPTTTMSDDINIKRHDDSLEKIILIPQDPPECRSPHSLSQRRPSSSNKYRNLRKKRRASNDEESCCSKERGLAHQPYATTLRCSKAYTNKLDPNIVMLMCALIGSLIAIPFGVGRQKMTTNDHPFTQTFFVKTPDETTLPDAELDTSKLNWFNRPEWSGQTYLEAVAFCASHEQVLCSYSSICPHGPGSKPINGGFTGDPVNGLAWAPTSSDGIENENNDNSWAQVGSKDYCLKYEFMHGGRGPAWGVSGEDNEKITRHVACCPPPLSSDDNAVDGQDSSATKSNELSEEGLPSNTSDVVSSTLKPTTHKIPVTFQDFDPIWYTHSDGWHGSTFEEALDFCLTKDQRSPCPYEAYCPAGPHHGPTAIHGGPTNEGIQSWSPIINEIGRGIVQVGGDTLYEDDTTMCKIQYLHDEDESSNGTSKQETNKGLESLMTHIMCCHLMDRES